MEKPRFNEEPGLLLERCPTFRKVLAVVRLSMVPRPASGQTAYRIDGALAAHASSLGPGVLRSVR